MDHDEARRALTDDLVAGLKRVVSYLMTTEDFELSQLLGNLMSGVEPGLYDAGGEADPGRPAELGALFDALCAAGYVDTAVSALIDLFRRAKGDAGAMPRRAFEAVFFEGARGEGPEAFSARLEEGELRPGILEAPPAQLVNIVRRAIDPAVGFVTPEQVEQQLHDFLERWSNDYRGHHGSWSGVFELE
jgi:hypothetical protein